MSYKKILVEARKYLLAKQDEETLNEQSKPAKAPKVEGLVRPRQVKPEPVETPEEDPMMDIFSRISKGGRSSSPNAGFMSGFKEWEEETMGDRGTPAKPDLENLDLDVATGRKSSLAADVSKSDGDNDSFINRLIQSESSGDTGASVTVKDGRSFVGAGQFGEDRLKDYMKANKTEFTQEQFRKDPGLQKEVMKWHISDIDKSIDKLGDKASKYSRDGLRAVAHLGGTGGMLKYVTSGGKYNPKDEFGTSLSKYYEKFR